MAMSQSQVPASIRRKPPNMGNGVPYTRWFRYIGLRLRANNTW